MYIHMWSISIWCSSSFGLTMSYPNSPQRTSCTFSTSPQTEKRLVDRWILVLSQTSLNINIPLPSYDLLNPVIITTAWNSCSEWEVTKFTMTKTTCQPFILLFYPLSFLIKSPYNDYATLIFGNLVITKWDIWNRNSPCGICKFENVELLESKASHFITSQFKRKR